MDKRKIIFKYRSEGTTRTLMKKLEKAGYLVEMKPGFRKIN